LSYIPLKTTTQLVEQLTSVQEGVGLNPAGGMIIFSILFVHTFFLNNIAANRYVVLFVLYSTLKALA